jgi:hypothetical protein
MLGLQAKLSVKVSVQASDRQTVFPRQTKVRQPWQPTRFFSWFDSLNLNNP